MDLPHFSESINVIPFNRDPAGVISAYNGQEKCSKHAVVEPHVIESNIDGPFLGWSGSTVFKPANGQVWEQDAHARTYHFAYRPNVTITEVDDAYLMDVDRVSGRIPVRRVHDFIESTIDGAFNGWDGKTVFRLANGQVWQQSIYAYHYQYAYRPEVLLYLSKDGWKLKMDGVHETVAVTKIK